MFPNFFLVHLTLLLNFLSCYWKMLLIHFTPSLFTWLAHCDLLNDVLDTNSSPDDLIFLHLDWFLAIYVWLPSGTRSRDWHYFVSGSRSWSRTHGCEEVALENFPFCGVREVSKHFPSETHSSFNLRCLVLSFQFYVVAFLSAYVFQRVPFT